MKITNARNGSALVYSLMIMSILLAITLGVAAVSVVEKMSATGTAKSIRALQVADSVVERFLQYSYDHPKENLQSFAISVGGGADCVDSSGVAVVNIPDVPGIADAKATITFEEPVSGGGDPDPVSDCDLALDQIGNIKSSGEFGNTTRTIETAQAVGQLKWASVNALGLPGRFSDGGSIKCAKDDRTGLVYLRGILGYTDPPGATSKLDGADSTSEFFSTTTLPDECPGPAADTYVPISSQTGIFQGVIKISADKSATVALYNTDGSPRGESVSSQNSNITLDGVFWSTTTTP